jgi:hypothetical protein
MNYSNISTDLYAFIILSHGGGDPTDKNEEISMYGSGSGYGNLEGNGYGSISFTGDGATYVERYGEGSYGW